ncbi:DUF2861 family protein [Vibrio natriegens]|jgi:hypothetical protein|nr:DUF2861 family protein [Vibrio natriegens]EPM40308.1 copper-sensing two-component system response regulator CusR [Vibrio natriegens NBRC 15636 = ATCC 14048 = DSM 759]MDX6028790.1 DUF2861 family protein [Vibrio natriegens NBRC 15636 = ATCC 14048 = DSM 759]UUI14494.1 DUF2861 family protein [Vibrio natriegens]WRS50698.1 DUF2861 family protein [Vibrio natriegens NBRC 15636 = ATCC 14048 = DSM 759]
MKTLLPVVLSLVLVKPVQAMDWFRTNTPLTQAHQHLLEDDLSGMFNTLVELWQTEPSRDLTSHLNDLLGQSLTKDCGKSLTAVTLPEWVSGVNVIRQTIQSPGRDTFRLVVKVRATTEVEQITFKRWVDSSISADSSFAVEETPNGAEIANERSFLKRYNLTGQLESGLYHLTVVAKDKPEYRTWVILGDSNSSQYVRWTSKENWKVEKSALRNPHCPLPQLEVGLYDYIEGQYEQMWKKTYESNYPESLELAGVPNDRYVLAVSINSRRWQGDIIVEQAQTISRTYDLSQED